MLEKVRERSVHLMIAHILVVGGSALAFFWLATILDPEIYGAAFFYVTVINLIIAVSVMGFQHVIMHQIPRLSEQGNNSKLSQLIHDSCNVSVTLSFFCAVLFCGWHYFIHPIPIPGADYSVLLLITICPIWAYLRMAPYAILSRGGTFSGIIPDQGFHALGLLIMPLLALLGLGTLDSVSFILTGQIITGVLGVLITAIYIKKYFKDLGTYHYSFFKPIKEWRALNFPFFFFSLSQQATQRSDLIVVGLVAGPVPLAIYGLALKISQLLYFPAMATRAAIAPRFSSLYEQNKQDEVQKLLLISTLLLAVVGVVLGAGLYFLSPLGLQFLDNIYLEDSLKILLILIAAELVISVFTPIKLKFLMQNSQLYISVLFFLGFIASVGLNVYFLPLYGIVAASYIRFGVMLAIHLAMALALFRKAN